jgi:hypothetical protein
MAHDRAEWAGVEAAGYGGVGVRVDYAHAGGHRRCCVLLILQKVLTITMTGHTPPLLPNTSKTSVNTHLSQPLPTLPPTDDGGLFRHIAAALAVGVILLALLIFGAIQNAGL